MSQKTIQTKLNYVDHTPDIKKSMLGRKISIYRPGIDPETGLANSITHKLQIIDVRENVVKCNTKDGDVVYLDIDEVYLALKGS